MDVNKTMTVRMSCDTPHTEAMCRHILICFEWDLKLQLRMRHLIAGLIILSPAMLETQSLAGPPVPSNDSKPEKRQDKSLTADETAEALSFAREHHAELARLLKRLSADSPAEFKRGIRDVYRSVTRLDRLQEKQPSRYSTELELWKLDSRIRLLAAKWTMSQDPELEKQILGLLQERHALRLKRLQDQVAQQEKQLQQMQRRLAALQEDSAVEREWKRLKARSTTRTKRKRSKESDSTTNQPTKLDKSVVSD